MMKRDTDGLIICPYNPECRCETPLCHKCGWYPDVAERRRQEVAAGMSTTEKLYKVAFTGYCEVWAKSPEEAADKAEDIPQQFFAHYNFMYPICLSKEEKNEVD